MARRVTVQYYDGAALQRSAVFEAFDGRLPVAGAGGLLLAFGAEELMWEDSCFISAALDGLSRRRLAEGIEAVKVFRQRAPAPGPTRHAPETGS